MDGLESGNKPRGLASLAGGARSIAPRMPEFVVTRGDAPHSAKSGQCPILEGAEQYGFVLASKCYSILCRPFRALIDGNRLPGALPRAVISWAFSPGIWICVHPFICGSRLGRRSGCRHKTLGDHGKTEQRQKNRAQRVRCVGHGQQIDEHNSRQQA